MDVRSLVSSVHDHTQSCLARYIDELTLLCGIDSGSEQKAGLDDVARYLADRMAEMGMRVTCVEHTQWGNDVLATLHGRGTQHIVLLGHMDTVYPPGTAAARPLRIDGDRLYAPGAADMKGCLLAALYALEGLAACSFDEFGTVTLLCVSDEEISHRHSEPLIRQVCRDAHAVLVLEAARENGDLVSARKGTAWYTLTAQGRSAHAGVEPEKGRNAIVELSHQVLQLYQCNAWREGLSICPGVICGGTQPNVVAEYAQARLDLRFLRARDRLDTEELWRECLTRNLVKDVALHLEREAFRDPMECLPGTMQLVTYAQEVARCVGYSLGHVLSGGTSDACYAADLGVPVLDGLGPVGGNDHCPDEYLSLSSIAPRTALLAGLMALIAAR